MRSAATSTPEASPFRGRSLGRSRERSPVSITRSIISTSTIKLPINTLNANQPPDALIGNLGGSDQTANQSRDEGLRRSSATSACSTPTSIGGLSYDGVLWRHGRRAREFQLWHDHATAMRLEERSRASSISAGWSRWNLGSISNSYTNISVSGQAYVGGLVGANIRHASTTPGPLGPVTAYWSDSQRNGPTRQHEHRRSRRHQLRRH